jgi:hypothetical protein
MYERVKAKEAELAFNAAKGRILKKLAGIKLVKNRPAVLYEIEKGKSQKGSYQAFKYAPLEEIDKHLRPLLLEEEMVRRSRLFEQLPGRNKLKIGSRLLVSPLPEIKFILCCCGVL